MNADPRAVANRVIWNLARQCRPDDVVIVGVATPLAAAAVLLARELLVPDLTVLLGTAVSPRTHDIAEGLVDAAAASRHAAGDYRQTEVLDALGRGRVTLQFVSPAQLDGDGAINASRVPDRDGGLQRLPGSLALADTAALVGRLVAYRAAHSRRFLVERVSFVTGAGRRTGRGIHAAVTDRAVIDFASGPPRLAAIAGGADRDDVRADCGFALGTAPSPAVMEEPPAAAVALLDTVIDPQLTRLLEVPAARAEALDRWERLVGG
ncbi:hypothetical protein [Pseudonocardia parietis]|uniref:Acyl CoA:acetate/3-ketoacid CoA transferase beta subunit n=1 Tax=Pseudonocardia parietis TaxID=570936 RepID=A0ABS4VV47_9PSEU|nr:hypothetical protein [Pseudonocardia parietis]MBP2367786.1 acyl CoA:acetate/3-ketoacid CoA transferase beta subunit [Pseudonocardia parietis]